ncbi:2-amino-4-hydroxy-6-hydroxymethyldihydropteridinediphosphokinase [Limimonas halophila]|uniref:2-amino-4-hydroxy-6-hydroxymethyldihydropteridine pyrophosphokinase n=1 Tax=Limimonas halophila TaxID=1082479 RepID=A0A1G7P250_9PROT|nr:2-amino-4-hydroxy-6-hydroxymethyldihydropteridine diphosphokinase [Limimonas halophila]SDF80304.1 2-amino-4-hydroxy-6-hydroxymethyldihydropteridinediphosphokinase [Limimonas halophila]
MVVIGLGANLPSAHGGPRDTLMVALDRLARRGLPVGARSRWYRSAPVPPSGQPWFVNGVAQLDTAWPAGEVLRALHAVEAELGRVRSDTERWPPRAVDLDLLDHDGAVTAEDDWPCLPHPRLHERAFVLAPLAELAPEWRHPVGGGTAAELLACLPGDQICEPDEAGALDA